MPLSALDLSAVIRFTLEKVVTDWPVATQGENQVAFSLAGLDVADWDDAYAAVLSIAGGADTTIDLQSVTNLLAEAVAFTAVIAVMVKVAPAVAADTDVEVVITPGASDGLDTWFATADGLALAANESFALAGDPAGDGVTVDATHKTLTFENTGTDDALVTVVIVGTTL